MKTYQDLNSKNFLIYLQKDFEYKKFFDIFAERKEEAIHPPPTTGNRPVDFVICWTKDGKEGFGKDCPWGGTGQAVEIAARKNIPVINLQNNDALERLSELTNFNFIDLYEEELDHIG